MFNHSVYEIKNFKLDNDELLLQETIFHNANGYIGVRSCFEEGYAEGYDSIRGSYLNGFYDIAEMKQAEKLYGLAEEKQTMINVADTQGVQLFIDGEPFEMFKGTVISSARWLDMEKGYTARSVVWRSGNGKEVELVIRRMTSFVELSLFTIEYQVKALNFDGELTFCSTHLGSVMNYSNPNDPRVAGESLTHLIPVQASVDEGISMLTTRTVTSNLLVCTAVANRLSSQGHLECRLDGHQANHIGRCLIEQGETVTLTKYTVFCDSLRYDDCLESARTIMHKVMRCPLNDWYYRQKQYLDIFWEQSLLEIDGDEKLSRAVCYNLYQLIQSVGKDKYSNIAAKGLSGEGYEGHFFWDTEIYIQPFFIFNMPNIAKSLIEYRYSILDAARDNAKIMGHSHGALYPWRTIMGKECSGYFPAGSAQYHINGDIAYSIIAYYLATDDVDLMADMGAEIIFETARLWINTGSYDKGLFRINEVTGPDEYTCLVNNNYFTNVSAQYNLSWAVKLYQLLNQHQADKLAVLVAKINLTESEIITFDQAAEKMYLPYDEELGINPQDDSFLTKPKWDIDGTEKSKFPLLLHFHPLCLYRHQVCKQADTVLAHFLFEDAQSLETIRKSFLYYEKVTTHDSSLSTCIYSIVASKLGLHQKAYDYFGDSAELDLFNTHHNTKDGIHTANMGGTYLVIVQGFGGLRLKESGLSLAPVLPEAWSGYRFQLLYRNSCLRVTVNQQGTQIDLLSGDSQMITVYGLPYELQTTLKIEHFEH